MRYTDDPYKPNIRSRRNAELEAEMKEYDEQVKNPKPVEQPEGGDPASPAATGWEKRYADLRSHSQKRENDLKKKIEELNGQLSEVTKQEIAFPKTKEEVLAWAERFPDLAGIIKTIALEEVQSVREEIQKTRKTIEQENHEAEKVKAFRKLLKAHPDFEEIRETDAFHDWVGEQTAMIRDALYDNDTDADAAIAAVDLYKYKTRQTPPKKDTQTGQREAARGVAPTQRTTPDVDSGGFDYTESQVAKMNVKEYAKHAEAIDKAMRERRFNYDISGDRAGAAR